ncbi:MULTISPECIES: GNAT family N-acetyltransferase [Pseudomonas]|uniref:GNAT family N-acetyltransferase n=1 Tax=Pseudomonas flavocrustae TaxID=2991719 RepID=A0ABT6IN84_9PSED|nr:MULTISPECIES: GNAT family N-acetyltransferase [Pseudomonas]MDH4765910.1 GNAT family N-acetyltransferase [Pseudomonas sp. CBMAI 2609]MDK8265382.1 GNAT family N-acetyltransferase [Pseudomonas oryzihabitans]
MPLTFQPLLPDHPLCLASLTLMRILRPHLDDAERYQAQLQRQAAQGYRLLAALEEGEVIGLAGYRELENLLYGRFLYVDDLVVQPARQRDGLGGRLLAAVRSEALDRGCSHLILDTGLHMPLAQRFYFRQGLLARGLHFAERLTGAVTP